MTLAYKTSEYDYAKDWFKSNIDWLIILIVSILFTICLFPINRCTYEEQGINKFLDREIVIDKTQITYDAQNQPIDTTYTFKYVE